MKKLTAIMMALVFILGMAQCKKNGNEQANDSYVGTTQKVTFRVDNGSNSKVEIDNTVLSELHFNWESTDKLYVYGSANGTFSDGQYCGELPLVAGETTVNGSFQGTLDHVPAVGGAAKLRFVYAASGFNATDKTITLDLSSQDGTLNNLESKIVAYADLNVLEEGEDYCSPLAVPYSIIKFDLSQFGTCNVTMTGMTKSGLSYSAKGVKSLTAGTSYSLTGVTAQDTAYYVAVMPESVAAMTFSSDSKTGTVNASLTGNTFYTATSPSGAGVVVTATTPKPDPTVTATAGCVSCTYTVGGTVSPTEPQTIEYGVVYSKQSDNPTPAIGGTGCTKEIVNTERITSSKSFTWSVPNTLETGVDYAMRTYAIGENGLPQYSSDVKTLTGGETPQAVNWSGGGTPGASPGVFTVGSGTTVRFSQGNLQYIGSATTPYWKFADHQFDILGTTTGQNSSDIDIDRDLFGWGTSGFNNKYPYMTSQNNSDYGNGSTNIAGTNYDWGVYNAISNGGNQPNMWRTLTNAEWGYLFNTRTNASSLYAEGKVGGCTAGVIILPDGWSWSGDVATYLSKWTSGTSSWSVEFSYSEWAKMEAAGAVFLPAAGGRYGTSVFYVGSRGYYWSSSYYSSSGAYYLGFYSGNVSPQNSYRRCLGYAVRLVR